MMNLNEQIPTATFYDGPITHDRFRFAQGAVTIELVRPADPDRLLDAPDVLAWNRRDDYMPYWAYLWPGAFLLAEAVARRDWPEGLTALEIGCGLGLAGLVALARGMRVEFTDYDAAPFEFIAQSAVRNRFDPACWSVARLDWRQPPSNRYPLILGADVLYERRLVPMVADLLNRLLEPKGVALTAGPYRVATEGLEAALASRDLAAWATPIQAVGHDGRSLRGTLHLIARKGVEPPGWIRDRARSSTTYKFP